MSNTNETKVAVVTGAAGGIGQAIVSALLSQNYKVALLDKDEDGLKRVVDVLGDKGERLKTYAFNVAAEQEVVDVMATVVHDFGRLDVLVNNAGILRDGLLIKAKEGVIVKKLSLTDWQAVMDINLTGVFLCGREAATQMIQCGHGGVIINMTSLARHGHFGQSSYSAAKAGVEALTVTWAQELSRFNIRAAGIAPGVIDTRMTAGMKPEALEELCKQIPSGRLGWPEEIGTSVLFILNNNYFNARILEVDGGLRF